MALAIFGKTLILVFIGVLALLLIANFVMKGNEPNIPSADQLAHESKPVIHINKNSLRVDIADEPHEQAQGLSGRESLREDEGMLFVFPSPLTPSFWMKDMFISLDMIWIDEYGQIIEITKNVSPNTYPATFTPPSAIKYVLEVNAEWSTRNNVKVGDFVTF